MKKGKVNYWIVCIFFFAGALISYLLSQFEFLQIDAKVNVTESIFSIITIVIGLYIAIALKKRQDRNLNLYNHLQTKLNSFWECFLSFSNQLEILEQISLSEINKQMKNANQKISPLKKIFLSFDLNENYVNNIENDIDNLEDLLTNKSKIKDNIVDYSNIKASIISSIDKINESFADAFKNLNDLI